MKYTLSQIASVIGATLDGNGNTEIESIASLDDAKSGQITFLSNSKLRRQLADCTASAVIISEKDSQYFSGDKLVMDNPYVGYAKLAQYMDSTPQSAHAIHPSSSVDESATLGQNVSIGASAVIEADVTIADNAQIGAGCFVGKNTSIGNNTKLWANVTVYHNIKIGNDCLFQSGAIIGSDGFGYANDNGAWIKIPQVGRVLIGDRVEIGANACIDRGALDDTVIADGVIIDNMVHIAHNVTVGENTAMAAMSVVAGSTNIGANCTVAGSVGINGHIDIVDNCHFTGMTMVTKSITEPGVYSSGTPATANRVWRKNAARFSNLDELHKRVKKLESEASDK